MAVEYEPVLTNPPRRPSRFVTGRVGYLANTRATVLRAYTIHRLPRVISLEGRMMLLGALALGGHYLYFVAIDQPAGACIRRYVQRCWAYWASRCC
jgi:hypothetical protein